MILDDWLYDVRRRFSPDNRIFLHYDGQVIRVASPFWPPLIRTVKPFCAYEAVNKVWKCLPSNLLPLLRGIDAMKLNTARDANFTISSIRGISQIDEVDVYDRRGWPHVSRTVKELWGLPGQLHEGSYRLRFRDDIIMDIPGQLEWLGESVKQRIEICCSTPLKTVYYPPGLDYLTPRFVERGQSSVEQEFVPIASGQTRRIR